MESIKDLVMDWLWGHWKELVMFKLTMITTVWLISKRVKFYERYHQFDYQMQMHSRRIDIKLLCRFKSLIEAKKMKRKKKQHMLHVFSIKVDNYALLCLESCTTVHDLVDFFEDIESLATYEMHPSQVRIKMNQKLCSSLDFFVLEEKIKHNFSVKDVLMLLENIELRIQYAADAQTCIVLNNHKFNIIQNSNIKNDYRGMLKNTIDGKKNNND